MRYKSFLAAGMFALCAFPALSEAPQTSLRPVLRPVAGIEAIPVNAAPQTPQTAKIEGVSKRPVARPIQRPKTLKTADEVAEVRFQGWAKRFAIKARRQGIPAPLLEDALAEVQYLPQVIDADRSQNEVTKTIWDYLDTAATDLRVDAGRQGLADYARSLEAIERKYRVDKEILVAIWGLESTYGAFKGETDVLSALATLAFDGRRGAFFEAELLAALQILAKGEATLKNFRGSWAGAMGHTQFMPSSFLAHAVDFDVDGRRDIWGGDPKDALASTAAYLQKNGWTPGQPWGIEVRLPSGFDYTQASRAIKTSPQNWQDSGIRAVTGQPIRNFGPASILLPAGHQGPAFMIFDNFAVLETYNTADSYVIGVGHLGDRIAGGPAIQASWPTEDRALTYDERIELQSRLNIRGFGPLALDGLIGPLTIEAVRAFQISRGFVPDGYASPRLLQSLR